MVTNKKMEKFEELAEKRVSETLKKFKLIGNLSNKNNYDYTDDHIKQIFDNLEAEIKVLKGRFSEESKSRDTEFKFIK
ncbi:hypothetical protein [Sporosarcina sp. 6E9]|uniref:hypothetical protein n=1 Tax=Sporosarcina sp. 6E9 TaxID=2819235 RepID=UPI001B305309